MEITAVILLKVNRCLFISEIEVHRFAGLTALPTVCRYYSKLKAIFFLSTYESPRQFLLLAGKYLRIDICGLISWTFARVISGNLMGRKYEIMYQYNVS